MSDDTPDTHLDNAEPSMEDILASIRRIIADEDLAENVEVAATSVVSTDKSFSVIEKPASAVHASQLNIEDDLTDTLQDIDLSLDGEEDDFSDLDMLLTDLEDDDNLGTLELNVLDIQEDFIASEEHLNAQPASLGVTQAVDLRATPTPKSMPDVVNDDDILETLDLMLESEDVLQESKFEAEPELNDFLKIPDSDAAEVMGDEDIEALLGDMFLEDDEEAAFQDERVIDPAADMLEEDDASDDISDELLADLLGDEGFDESDLPATSRSTDDLDLVKSLMADLTDDPYEVSIDELGDDECDENLDEMDMIDSVLSLSMEDEFALQSEDAAKFDAESDSIASKSEMHSNSYMIDINDDMSSQVNPVTETERFTLADIAKAAEADAARIERRTNFSATGFAAGAGMMISSAGPIAATLSESKTLGAAETQKPISGELEAEDILAEIDPSNDMTDSAGDVSDAVEDTIDNITPKQETADMAKAATKKDTIIDQVTEDAAAGAFASLNQVVENQAVVADRGDRIGDLVTEALRPMLKEWLDKNLKGIVERAVTKEVKRISSGK